MSFNAIKGQAQPINMLKGYIEQNRLEGGYLFIGPEGVGKKLVAKILAKVVNCQNKVQDSCDMCASCRKIENGQHPDVHIIEGIEPEIRIEYIRQLQREINLKPYEGKKKVFIINNAHKLNAESSNALLKILEEPPKDTLIILVSDKPAILFKTIISRCRILKFSPFKRVELKEILKKDYQLDNNTAHFLAYFSEGRIGLAFKLKETSVLRDKNRIIDKFAFLAKSRLDNLLMQNREDVRRSLNILASWLRDIYLIKIGMPHQELINFDRKDELLKLMSRFSFLDLNQILNCISDSMLYLDQNINIKLILHNLGAHLWKE